MKNFRLKNKFCLITGAGGLLGYEHAYALLEIGANIILTDIDVKKIKRSQKKLKEVFPDQEIIYNKLDITNEKSVQKCLIHYKKKNIFISVLLNNASFNPPPNKLNSTLLENYNINRWKKELDVGLTGAFICSKVFGTEMAKNKNGVILNISSDLSVISPDQRLYNKNDKKILRAKPVTYSVAKTGLIGLTRYIATYWSKNNVRCNAISPGGVLNKHNKIFVKKLNKLIPMGRMANRSEYRASIQFLCSDASSYMTGQNIVIDGGRSIW